MHTDPRTLMVPPPTPTGETRAFWEACRKGRLLLQRCDDCGRWVFYPRAACPFCWSLNLSWAEASGTGTVRSFTVIHKPGHPAWQAAVPYTVAVITLAEGPTMLTALVGTEPDDVVVGLPVQVTFVPVGEYTLPFFEPQNIEPQNTRTGATA